MADFPNAPSEPNLDIPASQWVDANVAAPAEQQRVLATDGRVVFIAIWSKFFSHNGGFGVQIVKRLGGKITFYETLGVTHWTPLPSAPRAR